MAIVAAIWLWFGSQIHQDFLSDHPDVTSGFVEIVEHASARQRKELDAFLREVIAARHTPSELAVIWHSSGAQLFIEKDGMPELFSELMKVLSAKLQDDRQKG